MATMPTDLTYGKVVGRLILAIADGPDADRNPDATPVEGSLEFVPKAGLFKRQSPPTTVIPKKISCSFDADGNIIDPQGAVGVWLVTGTYTVNYKLTGVVVPSHDIQVLPEHTDADPLDLTNSIPPGGPVLLPSQYAELSARIDAIPGGGGTAGDATATTKGIVQLAGDLGGTASAPTVPGLANRVPTTRKVNGKALSADIALSASDVDADPAGSAAAVQAQIPTTPAAIGAATAAQGAKADTALQPDSLATVETQLRTERSDRIPDTLLTKLDQTSGSAVIVVLGDSTGTGSAYGNWPDDLAALLGARFPGHKVTTRLWGGSSYGSVSTVANASATLTLDIYNGSVGATKADYPLTRIGAMLPARPDLVVLNYGHNYAADSPTIYQSSIDSLVSAIRSAWADAPVAVTSQNPRFSPAGNIAEHAARETAKRAWAPTREYGYIPAWEAFQAQASPSAWVQGDGIHPTTSGATDGSALWAAAVSNYLASRSKRPSSASSTPDSPTEQAINAQAGTAYTLVAADAGKLLTLNNASAITLTVPANVFTAGQRVDVLVLGAGMVTATAGSGAAVNGTPSLASRAQYSAFTVVFTSPTSAVVVGDLA